MTNILLELFLFHFNMNNKKNLCNLSGTINCFKKYFIVIMNKDMKEIYYTCIKQLNQVIFVGRILELI